MADFAPPAQFIDMLPDPRVRGRAARKDRLMAKAVLASGLAHLVLVVGLVCGPLFSHDTRSATPLIIDISIVEISGLETMVPPGAVGQSDEPKAQARIPDPVDLKPKSAPQRPKETIQKTTSAVMKKVSASHESTVPVVPPIGKASVGGGSEAIEHARVSYRDLVASKLARAKRYPERAVRNQIIGRGVIRLKIDASGSVVSVHVSESTQSEVLDDELLRMVERASPFPAFPETMKQTDLSLLIPVSFRLDS